MNFQNSIIIIIFVFSNISSIDGKWTEIKFKCDCDVILIDIQWYLYFMDNSVFK